MKPLERVAEAISRTPFSSTLSIDRARAALLALAECELHVKYIKAGSEAIDWGGELCENAETLFNAILRSIANDFHHDIRRDNDG